MPKQSKGKWVTDDPYKMGFGVPKQRSLLLPSPTQDAHSCAASTRIGAKGGQQYQGRVGAQGGAGVRIRVRQERALALRSKIEGAVPKTQ